jgi:hypothetical protein
MSTQAAELTLMIDIALYMGLQEAGNAAARVATLRLGQP